MALIMKNEKTEHQTKVRFKVCYSHFLITILKELIYVGKAVDLKVKQILIRQNAYQVALRVENKHSNQFDNEFPIGIFGKALFQ